MAGPITWRSIAAPDATGAAQILQQAGQNIGRGVDAFKSIADNQVARITDENVSTIAQQIMGAGEGYEGLNNLSALESSLQGVDAANVGGSAGLSRIMEMVSGRRTELEAQATDAFNDALVRARQTGDFTEVNQQKDLFGSLVRNSASTLEAARSGEASYKASQLLAGLTAGTLEAGDLLKNPEINLNEPEYAKVFELAANQIQGQKLGGVMRNITPMIGQVSNGVMTASEASNQLLNGFSDLELAQNAEAINNTLNQLYQAEAASKQLPAGAEYYLKGQEQYLNQQDQLKAEYETILKNNLTRAFGGDVRKINAFDMLEKGMSVTELMQTRLPELDAGQLKNAQNTVNRFMADGYDIAEIAYALDMNPNVTNLFWKDNSAFKAALDKSRSELNSVRNAYSEYEIKKLQLNKDFIDYKRQGYNSLGSLTSELINNRNNSNYTLRKLPPFEFDVRQLAITGRGAENKPVTGNPAVSVTDDAATITGQPRTNQRGSGFMRGLTEGVNASYSDASPLSSVTQTAGVILGSLPRTALRITNGVTRDISDLIQFANTPIGQETRLGKRWKSFQMELEEKGDTAAKNREAVLKFFRNLSDKEKEEISRQMD